jgi:hypothetical protein
MRSRTCEGDGIATLSTLAKFPCSADKRPMTQHGFKDAGYAPTIPAGRLLVSQPPGSLMCWTSIPLAELGGTI